MPETVAAPRLASAPPASEPAVEITVPLSLARLIRTALAFCALESGYCAVEGEQGDGARAQTARVQRAQLSVEQAIRDAGYPVTPTPRGDHA